MRSSTLISFGEFYDYLEWRRRGDSPQISENRKMFCSHEVSTDPQKPVLRIYNNGETLYSLNRKGRLYRLKPAQHNRKPLSRVPGAVVPNTEVIFHFSADQVGLQYGPRGSIERVPNPSGEVCSLFVSVGLILRTQCHIKTIKDNYCKFI